jgi:hypothetical protein
MSYPPKYGTIYFSTHLLKSLGGLVVLAVIFVFVRSYFAEDALMCNSKLDEVRFSTLQVSSDGKRSTYKFCSGDIEGEIVLTSEDSYEVGRVIINSLIFGLKSTFADSRAPYGGQITSMIGCINKKYVKEQTIFFDERATKIILAVANDRQIFGICAENEIKYVSAVWAGYDAPKKRVAVIRIFKPIVNLNDIDPSQKDIMRVFEKAMAYVREY